MRVFVGSTMDDLANERDAVVQKLSQFNITAVNAESWSARDCPPWTRIVEQIQSCDLFVLILGESYGYEPERGPGAGSGLSVTHMEYRHARDVERMPVLVFLKRLSYDRSKVDDRRDAFREEVRAWETGHLTVEFALARDLAEKVASAIMEMLADAWTKSRVESRSESVARRTEAEDDDQGPRDVRIPTPARQAIAERSAVLVAGAGMSLEAGLPDARLYSEILHRRNVDVDPRYWRGPASSLESVAEDYELATDRNRLVADVIAMMEPARGPGPGVSHGAAVELFDTIVTTNFDCLFETAAEQRGTNHAAVNRACDLGSGRRIVHLRGSTRDPTTLALTESDMDRDWRSYWWDLRADLLASTVIVIGTSLNDPALMGLLAEREREHVSVGYFVTPGIHRAAERRLETLKLEHVDARARDFFHSLR